MMPMIDWPTNPNVMVCKRETERKIERDTEREREGGGGCF